MTPGCFAFECNPQSLEICSAYLGQQPGIQLVSKAVWDGAGALEFFPVTSGNVFASSCFPASGGYPYERYEQASIQVEAVRLDEWCTEHGVRRIDLLCIDLQGACLRALRGLGELIDSVGYILAEVESVSMYNGEDLLEQVVPFLSSKGFRVATWISQWGTTSDGRWLADWGVRRQDQELDSWWGYYLFVRSEEAERRLAEEICRQCRFLYRRLQHDERELRAVGQWADWQGSGRLRTILADRAGRLGRALPGSLRPWILDLSSVPEE